MKELTEKEYFEIGKSEKMPKRCPILDICERRMWTLFIMCAKGSEEEKYPLNTEEELLKFLNNEKGINSFNDDSAIRIIGEEPVFMGDKNGGGFGNMCPEVFLFEKHNYMPKIPRIATSSGWFHGYYEKNFHCQHYTECAEFSKYYFELKHGKKVVTIENRRNYVYLMKNKRNGLYKIGKSHNPKYREKTLHSQEPEIELIEKWEVFSNVEKELHKMFEKKRQRGEWFLLEHQDIELIKNFIEQKTQSKK